MLLGAMITRQRHQPTLLATTAVLCLSAFALSLGHDLVVEHAYCESHAEWVHTTDSHSESSLVDEAQSSAISAGDVDEHEHCEFVATREDDSVDANDVSTPTTDVTCTVFASDGFDDHFSFRPLLAFAPKQSPPA